MPVTGLGLSSSIRTSVPQWIITSTDTVVCYPARDATGRRTEMNLDSPTVCSWSTDYVVLYVYLCGLHLVFGDRVGRTNVRVSACRA